MNKLSIALIFLTLTISGCTSIKSSYLGTARDEGGLVYHMPKRDLIVEIAVVDTATVSFAARKAALYKKRSELLALRKDVPNKRYLAPIDKEISVVDKNILQLNAPAPVSGPLTPPRFRAAISSIEVSDAYPDTAKSFSVHPGLNHFGKNTLDIGITNKGLLSTAKSKNESQFSDAITNLASSAGALSVESILPQAPAAAATDVCSTVGTHQLRFRFEGDFTWSKPKGSSNSYETATKSITCAGNKFDLTLDKLWDKSARNGPNCKLLDVNQKPLTSTGDNDCADMAGLFYRQPLPYSIVAKDSGGKAVTTTVYSPSEAPINMLPIKRSFFADSETDFVFVDGVPTKYTEVSEGEAVSFLKIPADVISAYFSAIGSTFDALKSTDNSEIDSLKKGLELELFKLKLDACESAIDQNDQDRLESLEC